MFLLFFFFLPGTLKIDSKQYKELIDKEKNKSQQSNSFPYCFLLLFLDYSILISTNF